MKLLRLAIFGILVLAAEAGTAATTVTQWGVKAATAYADCSLAGCDASGLLFGLWLPTNASGSGGLNQTFAAQIDVPQVHDTVLAGDGVNMGVTSAQVELDNASVSVPVLKAKAGSLDFNGWVSALAFGMQGYQYTGAAATTLSLDAALSGTIVNPSPASDVTGFSIGVWLLRPDPALSFPSTPPATLGEFVGSVLAATLTVDSWLQDVTAAGSVSASTGSDPLVITVDPGGEFYLMAGLVASATDAGRAADAFGTLTMSFQDSANLVAASAAAVPEPRTHALFVAGLALVFGCAACRRRLVRARASTTM